MAAPIALSNGTAPRLGRPSRGPSSILTTSSGQPLAGPSRSSAPSPAPRRPQNDDPVRAAQEEATRVWKADMRKLLERAEERFADVCWTTASADTLDHHHLDSELGHLTSAASSSIGHPGSDTPHHALIPPQHTSGLTSIPSSSAAQPPGTLIWAHKAILYARAPNTFQTRFLNLRSPAAQLERIGSTASLVSLPLHRSVSQLSLASDFSSSTQTGATTPNASAPTSNQNSLSAHTATQAKPRKSIRGTAPPSSFSMTKPSLRKPISRSSISRPLRKGSMDGGSSLASGFATSDSEGEGGPASSLRASRLINTRPTSTSSQQAALTSPSKLSQTSSTAHGPTAPGRKPSFASVASTVESHLSSTRSVVSDTSTLRAPISLGGVSHAFFEATLQYLYTGEEPMVDAFEFLFEDRLASGSEITPDEKLDKLRSDLTFMWRSKLYSDVKIVLGDDDDDQSDVVNSAAHGRKHRGAKMIDIPDANMSVLSLAQTIDTDRIDESDAEDDELTSFSTHRMILASRSQYFASMLLSPYADARAPVLHLPSPPFTPASLHFTLGFLYTGTLFFSNRTFDLSTAFSLWRAGAYLQIETLQALVAALIDREFCHGFACSPPCRKCVRRVPRTLAFATSPDVSEQALQGPAIAAVSGAHFGMYWAKDVGNLDPMLQDRIVDTISDRLSQDPSLVVSVLRQLSIVGQRIDTERSSRWVESLRLMAETVENRVMPILHANLDKIVQSTAWSDLLDGVGSLGDVLEKCLVMLIDGLTEARAAQVYQTLVGQVLLREQGFDVPQSRQAVETCRGSILRYLKKRWINVRALAGFNKLEKWCLKEIADELDVTTADLILLEQATPAKVGGPPSRLLAARRSSSLADGVATANAGTTSARSAVGSRSSLGATATNTSRLRSTSAASNASSSGSAASPVRRPLADDGEREGGPIHMRAAVLNRNAARTSVANGHRTVTSASPSPASSPAPRPGSSTNGVASTTIRSRTASSSSTLSNGKPANLAARARAGSDSPTVARSATPSAAKQQRIRTTSGTSVASVATARSTSGKTATNAAASSTKDSSAAAQAASTVTTSTSATTPKRPTTGLPTPDANKTPTKTIRPVRSSATLAPRPTATQADTKPAATSVDSAASHEPAKPPVLGHKSSFLRATPGPGGTFSLSSSDSGRDLRARTISNASRKEPPASTVDGAAGVARSRSTTPTKSSVRSVGRRSTSPASTRSIGSGSSKAQQVDAMPADALSNVEKAKQGLPRSDSTKTIVYRPEPDDVVDGGVSLNVGIGCIVSLPGGKSVQRQAGASKVGSVKRGAVGTASPAAAGTSRKVRAQVRYLGPVQGKAGLWVGVTLNLPPSVALPASMSRLKDGLFNGARYYRLENEVVGEAQHRFEHRRDVWSRATAQPSAQVERKVAGGRGERVTLTEIFVRPADVVWVVQ